MTTIPYPLKQKNNLVRLRSREKVIKIISVLLIGCSFFNTAQGQADKRLQLADQYFAAGEYITAAGLYGQFLNPVAKKKTTSDFPLNSKKNREGRTGEEATKQDIVYKQAESYRLANYWSQASALYKECFEKDPVKYAAAFYWHAVCERSMGNYSSAEESIHRYLQNNDSETLFKEAAEKEKAVLQFIKSQLTRPDSILYHVQQLETSLGAEKGFFAPAATMGNGFLITSTQTDSITLPGINPYHNRLFHSVLVNNGLQNFEPVIVENIDETFNQGAACVHPNGNYLYFTQWKKENGRNISSIYFSTKNATGWSQPVLLSSINRQGSSSKQPFCSADGKYLFFASDREGGKGNFDIWLVSLRADGTTEEPINLGLINTSENEQAPFYHNASSTLVFSSDRLPGMGGYDLFTAKGKETTWKEPENIGHPVNSSRDDIYFFAPEKETILTNAFFSSDRGSDCCLATYTVSKTPKKKIIAGFVNDCRNNEPLVNVEVLMKDASGKTLRAITGEGGKYVFELDGDDVQQQFSLSKEKYNDKASGTNIERTHKEGWLTDTLFNETLCMEKKLVIKVENVVTVYFDFDQSKLKDRGIVQLDSIYNILMEDTTATIQVSGYTDGLGSVEYNKKLSDKRAKSCADYLIEKGINAARISFESFGACCPVEMELINGRDNPDGRSMNRRALINISKD